MVSMHHGEITSTFIYLISSSSVVQSLLKYCYDSKKKIIIKVYYKLEPFPDPGKAMRIDNVKAIHS